MLWKASTAASGVRNTEVARSKGLAQIMGLVLTHNAPMLRLVANLGFTVAAYPEDPDFRIVTKSLQAASGSG